MTSHSSITATTRAHAARLPAHRKRLTSALVLTRVFNASQARVFRAFTEPALLKRWWAPHGWSTPYCTVNLRKGGLFHYCMRSPERLDIWGRGIFREVVPPRRIVYLDAFSDAEGNLVEPSHYGMGKDHPLESQVTVSFAKIKGRTSVTLRHEVPRVFREREQMQKGWGEMFDRLDELLAETSMDIRTTKTETIFTRVFAVPRERLFQAWTDAELLAAWWGPHGFTNPVCTTDPRPGGALHIVMRSPEGVDQSLKGCYIDIEAPKRLIFTDKVEHAPPEWLSRLNSYRHKRRDAPFPELASTVLFDDLQGWTRLTLTTCFRSPQNREAVMKMGYHEGMAESLERLEELFTSCSMLGEEG